MRPTPRPTRTPRAVKDLPSMRGRGWECGWREESDEEEREEEEEEGEEEDGVRGRSVLVSVGSEEVDGGAAGPEAGPGAGDGGGSSGSRGSAVVPAVRDRCAIAEVVVWPVKSPVNIDGRGYQVEKVSAKRWAVVCVCEQISERPSCRSRVLWFVRKKGNKVKSIQAGSNSNQCTDR